MDEAKKNVREGQLSNQMYQNNPYPESVQETVPMSDVDRFIEGIKVLAEECHLTGSVCNGFGLKTLIFADGTQIGGLRIWMESGIVSEKKYKEQYGSI